MPVHNKRKLSDVYEHGNIPNENPFKKSKIEITEISQNAPRQSIFKNCVSDFQLIISTFLDDITLRSFFCAYPRVKELARSSMLLARAFCARSEKMALNEVNSFLNNMVHVQDTDLAAAILRLGGMKPETLFIRQTEQLKMINLMENDNFYFQSLTVPKLISDYFNRIPSENKNARVSTFNDQKTFLKNLNEWFRYDKWKHILNEFQGLIMAGGSVTHAAVANEPARTRGMQDVDLFLANVHDTRDLGDEIIKITEAFQKISKHPAYFRRSSIPNEYCNYEVYTFYVHLHPTKKSELDWVRKTKRAEMIEICEPDQFVKFQLIVSRKIKRPHTYVENFDLDVSQCLFDGENVKVTYAWMQAFQTNTCLSFAQSQWNALWGERVVKYSKRYGLDILLLHGINPQHALQPRFWYYQHEHPHLFVSLVKNDWSKACVCLKHMSETVDKKRRQYEIFLRDYWVPLFKKIHKKVSEAREKDQTQSIPTLQLICSHWPTKQPIVALKNDECSIFAKIIARNQNTLNFSHHF